MYGETYDNMVDAEIAIELDSPISMDIKGNEVDHDNPKKMGLPSDLKYFTLISFYLQMKQVVILTNERMAILVVQNMSLRKILCRRKFVL
jgi:hypothetical protein